MKKFPFYKIMLLVWLSMRIHIHSYSLSYHKPLPHSIDFDKIHKAKDICSITISKNIHAPLFTKKDSNYSSPYLIERYLVSKNKLIYKFKLKDMSFHDNTLLTAEIVKKSIEYSIKNNNYNLFSILGANDFFNGKQNSIQGIILDSKNLFSFTIVLNKSDPNFINKLADQSLSILKPTRESMIGLGPYKIQEINENNIVLVKFNQSPLKNNDEPDKIIYYTNIPKNIALSGFITGRFDDISLYDPFKYE